MSNTQPRRSKRIKNQKSKKNENDQGKPLFYDDPELRPKRRERKITDSSHIQDCELYNAFQGRSRYIDFVEVNEGIIERALRIGVTFVPQVLKDEQLQKRLVTLIGFGSLLIRSVPTYLKVINGYMKLDPAIYKYNVLSVVSVIQRLLFPLTIHTLESQYNKLLQYVSRPEQNIPTNLDELYGRHVLAYYCHHLYRDRYIAYMDRSNINERRYKWATPSYMHKHIPPKKYQVIEDNIEEIHWCSKASDLYESTTAGYIHLRYITVSKILYIIGFNVQGNYSSQNSTLNQILEKLD